ncbi:LacI family transcriptional regulator [Devosia lacusdianchii]|uniref:LacI family transcriptional regulator n=1 Tax=Devosia lacusdianchii TaxID=2917991 RepID=UPI001F05CA72|nr:LacI family transcriptional regulator [Devosia sp. JXJ CY 41]
MNQKTTISSKGRATTANQRVTLRTIADVTGLSLSTVSLSLRGGTTLKQETRDKVAEAAAALGYVPDRAGVRLRTGKTNVIALVLDGSGDSIDFARKMIQGIGQSIQGTRYHMTVTPEFDRHQSPDNIRYILDNRTADGVIITHTTPRDKRVQLMIDADFPFVSHGRTEFYTPHAYHDFHAEVFATMAVDRLAAKGARNVLLAVGDDSTTNHHNIVTAYHRAAAKAGINAQILDTRLDGLRFRTHAEMRTLGLELAKLADHPDGIICDSEMYSIALLSGLQEGGLMLGRDVHMIYKQTSDIVPTLFPTLDSIREDVFAAGVELTRLLLKRIEGEPAQQLQTLAEPIASWRS